MLYTSYFARAKNLDESKYHLYGITAKKCAWFKGKNLTMLAPKWDHVCAYKEHRIDLNTYEKYYTHYLDEHETEVLDVIKSLPDNSVLLCYEKYKLLCHRNTLSKWLNKKGIAIKELECTNKKETI